MIKLNIQFAAGQTKIELNSVQKIVSVLDKEKSIKTPESTVINVRVVDQSKVREYNQRYGGRDEATDVLSFNYVEKSNQVLRIKNHDLGDIVISYQHVISQAAAAETSAETELTLLILHGILHLFGYDHQNIQTREELDKLQGRVMAGAGLKYRNFNWQDK